LSTGGKAALAIWVDIESADDAFFEHWHSREHLGERVSCPGWLRGSRFRGVTRPGRYLLFYDAENAAAFDSEIYYARLRAPSELSRAIAQTGPLPPPGRGRVSRRVKSFPITHRVTLRPDEKAQRWLLSVSASDRVGLLYSIARVLARHRINLQLAKVTTLGERVEDTFLIDGPELQQNKAQIAIETELLEALAA